MELYKNQLEFQTNDKYSFEMDVTIYKEKEEGKRKPTIDIEEKILQNKPFVDRINNSKLKFGDLSKCLNNDELGTTMNGILNNYESIIKCVRKHKLKLDSISEQDELENQKSYYDVSTKEEIEEFDDPLWLKIFGNLKEDLYNIDKKWSPILLIDFYTFEKDIFLEIPKYRKQLEERISELKKKKTQSSCIINLEKQYYELNTHTYYKNKCIEFLTEFVQRLINIKLYVDNSFPKISPISNVRNYIQDENNFAPTRCDNYFIGEGFEEYRYTFTTFEELFYITIHHIVNSWNRVVSRCEYSKCRKYMIPKQSNMIFCQNDKCNKKGPDEKYNSKKQKAFLLCQALIKRLNTRIELEDDDEEDYKNILEKINKKYTSLTDRPINSWSENEVFKENGDFHIFLTILDKEFQNKYGSIKGDFTTNKYWYKV